MHTTFKAATHISAKHTITHHCFQSKLTLFSFLSFLGKKNGKNKKSHALWLRGISHWIYIPCMSRVREEQAERDIEKSKIFCLFSIFSLCLISLFLSSPYFFLLLALLACFAIPVLSPSIVVIRVLYPSCE
jgi:hypothetical protein